MARASPDEPLFHRKKKRQKEQGTHVHGAEDEDTNEQEVRQLEQAVVLPPHEVERGYPHRHRAQSGHPPHGDIEAVVVLLRGSVDRLPHRVRPPFHPQPVRHEEEAVEEERREGQVAGEGVVQDGTLVGDAQRGPYLAVAGDGHEDDGEVRGGREAEVDRDSFKPAKGGGGGRRTHGRGSQEGGEERSEIRHARHVGRAVSFVVGQLASDLHSCTAEEGGLQ